MDLQEYLEKHKQIEKSFFQYIDKTDNIEENYQNLINLFDLNKIQDDCNELKLFFHFLLNIANNHYRFPGFWDKIFQIITYFKDSIQKHYSNSEIFNIFKSNKRILLFLVESKIFEINKNISILFLTSNYTKNKYPHYFYPEIKSFLDEMEKIELLKKIQKEIDMGPKSEGELIEIITQQRSSGENESEICKLIRQDSVDDFDKYIQKNKLPFDSIIKPSLFETNQLLIEKKARIFDYCAFFGSSKIFKYIHKDLDIMKRSTWLFAVHGQNEKIFHKIDSKKFDSSYTESIIIESIKCHHNDFINVIKDVLVNESTEMKDDYSTSYIEYYNFLNINPDIINQSTFAHLAKCDYYNLVKFLLKNVNIDVNTGGILIDFNSIVNI